MLCSMAPSISRAKLVPKLVRLAENRGSQLYVCVACADHSLLDQLAEIRQEDSENIDLDEKTRHDSLQSFSALSADSTHSLQYQKILEIRSKLREYSK